MPGGNISYECLGNNQYVITLTLFEDCGTAFISNGPESISITNSCGINFPTTYQLPIITFREEVSQLCAPLLAQSECNGGSFLVFTNTFTEIPYRYLAIAIAGFFLMMIVVEMHLIIYQELEMIIIGNQY